MLIDYAEFTGNREGYDPADIDPDTLYLNGHFGTFNGNDVVSIWAEGRPGTADVKGYSIEGYHIARLSSGSMSVVVYTGSTFVCVYDAYEQGLLTYENVRAMGFYRIRESYVWNLGHDGFNYVGTDVTFDDVVIYEYYEPNKNYWYRDSGLFVAMGFRDAPESARQVQVAGYTFDLPLGSRDIYAPFGWVRSIAEDYESGWLSRTQLSVLYGTHFNRDYPIPGEVQSNGEFLYRYNPWVSGLEILDFDHDSWEHGNAYMASDFRIDIPAEIDGVPVRGIAEGAFSGWTPSSPTIAVILPEGLTHIGVRSFNFYTNTLPNSPTWSPVIIPDSVIFIGELAFGHNLGLTVIHRGVTYRAARGSHRSGEMPQAFYDAVNSQQPPDSSDPPPDSSDPPPPPSPTDSLPFDWRITDFADVPHHNEIPVIFTADEFRAFWYSLTPYANRETTEIHRRYDASFFESNYLVILTAHRGENEPSWNISSVLGSGEIEMNPYLYCDSCTIAGNLYTQLIFIELDKFFVPDSFHVTQEGVWNCPCYQ
jgi:hypothetical protein